MGKTQIIIDNLQERVAEQAETIRTTCINDQNMNSTTHTVPKVGIHLNNLYKF